MGAAVQLEPLKLVVLRIMDLLLSHFPGETYRGRGHPHPPLISILPRPVPQVHGKMNKTRVACCHLGSETKRGVAHSELGRCATIGSAGIRVLAIWSGFTAT